MPNWIENIITFSAKDISTVQKIADTIHGVDSDGETDFDFNKVIPMPKELGGIDSGGYQNDEMEAYLTAVNPECEENYEGFEKLSKLSFQSISINAIPHFGGWQYDCKMPKEKIEEEAKKISSDTDAVKKFLDEGKKYIDNVVNYGYPTWYEWRQRNWGTKWNASDASFNVEKSCLSFSTAWSMPDPVIVKLSAMFPNVSLLVEWADEDIGSNCGRAEVRNGEVISSFIPGHSEDAVRLSCEIWNIDPDEYLKYDENKEGEENED